MWRGDEENPFHTEVGYWLWDSATGEVLRSVSVPRGISVLAGGTAAADATSFSLRAAVGDPQYPIGEGKYLTANASSVTFEHDRHPERRRHVELRRDDDAPDDGVRGPAAAHGPQHAAQGRLGARGVGMPRRPDGAGGPGPGGGPGPCGRG